MVNGMRATRFLSGIFLASVFVLVMVAGGGVARADDTSNGSDPKFQIDFTPYVWLPTINGTFRFHASDIKTPSGVPIGVPIAAVDRTFDTQIGPNSYLSNVNFALMGTVTAHFGRVGLLADLINVNIASASARVVDLSGPFDATISSQSQVQLVTTLLTVAPSYTLYRNKSTAVDFLVGLQSRTISANANLQLTDANGNGFSAGALRKSTYNNLIVGSYGHVGLGGHWTVPYYVDAGFGPTTSWEGLVGIQYGNLSVNWRYLQYNAASGSDSLLQRLTLGGPMLGYTLRF
jgi:hypothetical protein